MVSSFSTVKLGNEEVVDRFLTSVDVWEAIFEMLPVKDRIRLEMTNKRLHMLMFEYWKRVTSFDTERVTEMSFYSSIYENRCAAFVSICVNRIGDGLRSLTIRGRSTHPIDCWTDNLPSIGEGCPNVETINFVLENWTLERRALDILPDLFSHLKTLTVSAAEGRLTDASASIFLSIPTSIEVISGLAGREEEPFENAAQIEGFFADRPSLREVYLGYLYTRDKSKADIFRVMAERCPHLKSIDLSYSHYNCIDFRGVIALESMKELRVAGIYLNEMQIVTICERSPLVEVLDFGVRFSSNFDLQSAVLNALGSLTKLDVLFLNTIHDEEEYVLAPSLVTEFVRALARNSGASLQHLSLGDKMPLSTVAIDALANGCAKLRNVGFNVRVGEAEPASIRFLIDCIVADLSWFPQIGERALWISIGVMHDGDDEAEVGRAAFEALAAPAAHVPAGVELIIR